MQIAYIALGSNLNDPHTQVKSGINAIAQLPHTQLIKTSSLYQSKYWGNTDQNDVINAVIKVQTELSAHQLLESLLDIEQDHHRTREIRYGARTLDCDLILFGTQQINTQALTVPHPRMQQRIFVLAPLMEIEPDLAIPNGQSITDLYQQCEDKEIIKL